MNTINPKGPKDTSEAVLISQKVVPYLHSLGYQYLNSNFRVSDHNGNTTIDLVAYLDQTKSEPHIVVETKQKLPDEITLLDPAVQKASGFAVVLGPSVRYLLITDGNRYYWFERSSGGQTLVRLNGAPKPTQQIRQQTLFTQTLVPVTDPEQFMDLMQSIMRALVREGVGFGLRMGIEMNRILIAKLHDEQILYNGGANTFRSNNKTIDQVAHDVRQLYHGALAQLEGQATNEGLWFLSPPALFTVVRILEPFALSTVTESIRSHLFWQLFSDFSRGEGGLHTTPVGLTELLVKLTQPRPNERIIDPACGTGLFLIQAYRYIEAQKAMEQVQGARVEEANHALWQDIIGIEWNAEVAELAGTNCVLNGISPKQVIRANALDQRELEHAGLSMESFDIVLLDPPVGPALKDTHLLRHFAITQLTNRITQEMLFLEQSIKLLRHGGLLAILLPDGLLSSPTYSPIRNWILENTRPRAIISLPPEAFAPVGHAGKASILLLSKEMIDKSDEAILMADIQSIGYDKSGRITSQNDLAALTRAVSTFFETGQIEVNEQESKLQIWSVTTGELRDKSWSASQLNPANLRLIHRIVQLRDIVEISSGQGFKNYVKKDHNTAMVLRVGDIRDLTLDLADVLYIPLQEYNRAKRAQVKVGDVLVTTTGQYLRASAIEQLPIPAVASNNITILRPLPDAVDPFFLAAVINSDLGKQQIVQKQIISAGRPFIRRDDLGTISIPLPRREKQREIAIRLQEMIRTVQKLTQLAQQIDAATKELVMTELLAGDQDA
jgi:type I restriction enzyme M protein